MNLSITDPNKYCFSKRYSQPYKEILPSFHSAQLPQSRLTLSLPKLVKSKKQYYSQYRTISYSTDKIPTKKTIIKSFLKNKQTIRKVKVFKSITDINKKMVNQDKCVTKCLELPNQHHHQKIKQRLYFGVFDGHGGERCSQFLSKRMHQYISRQKLIQIQPIKALKSAFNKVEEDFLNQAMKSKPPNHSGSCAIILLSMQFKLYLANTGDSRCIGFCNGEEQPKFLTVQHSPSKKKQYLRIITNGGKVVKSKQTYRVIPGHLNVSRTLGDLNCKVRQFGGLPGVIIHQPDIQQIQSSNLQYLLLCSDGLIDGISKQQIHKIYKTMRQVYKRDNQFLNQFLKEIVEQTKKKNGDNICVIMILFQ